MEGSCSNLSISTLEKGAAGGSHISISILVSSRGHFVPLKTPQLIKRAPWSNGGAVGPGGESPPFADDSLFLVKVDTVREGKL
jgi:hypothetical protein